MKIILVHGDYTEKTIDRIEKFIDVAKNRGWRIERLNESDSQSLPEQIRNESLFKEDRLYLLENVNSVSKKELEWLKKNYKDLPGNLVVYHNNQLPKTLLSKLPKPDKEELYKLPKSIWKFLDSFHPGNYKKSLNLFRDVLKNESPEFVVALLAQHLRDLYISKRDVGLLKYQSWRVKKLTAQAKYFSEEELRKVIAQISEADYQSKTSSKDIVSALDLIIATKIE